MLQIESKLTGDLEASLDAFSANVGEKVLFSGVAAMAKVMYDEVLLNVPVKSGLLKSAIYRVYSPEKSTELSKLYRISWNKKKAPHGHLIESGSSRAPAHPFVRPAFDKIESAIEAGKTQMAKSLSEIGSE